MATLVDALSALKNLGVYETILPFLLITAGTYAILTKYKPFGETKGVNAIVATIIGLVFISFAKAVSFINLLIPFLTVFLIMIVLAILIFTFIGIKGETLAETFKSQPAAYLIIIFIFIFIVVIVYSLTFPEVAIFLQSPVLAQQLNISPTGGPGATPSQQAMTFLFFQIGQTILSPQILGLIILFVVFAIAIFFITYEGKKS
jgi:hypothetical protein